MMALNVRSKPSTEPYIRRILFDLTEKDFNWLDKAVKSWYVGESVKEIIDKAVAGIYTLWRIGDEEGFFSTYVEDGYLWCACLAGKGYIQNLPKIQEIIS